MVLLVSKGKSGLSAVTALGSRCRAILSTRVARDTYLSLAVKIASTGLLFATTVLLARLLGPKGYGTYAYAYSIAMLLAMPANGGLQNLVLRETARGMAQDRLELVRGLWKWGDRAALAVSLAVIGIIGSILVVWQWRAEALRGKTLLWALALVPFISLSALRGAALRGLKLVVTGQLPESVFRPGLFLLAIVCTAILAGVTLSPALAMVLHVGAAFLAFLTASVLLWRYAPPPLGKIEPSIDARAWLNSGMVLALIGCLGVVNNQASTVILGLFEPMDQVGIYRVAVQVATLASFGLQTVNMVVAPRFADLYARGHKERLQRLVTGSARVVLAFNMVLTAGFVLLGRPFFSLVFGAKFAASYLPLLILLTGQIVNSAAGSVGFLLNMTGYERETMRGLATSVGASIALNLGFIPIWDVRGAAIATALSMALWNAILWMRARKVLGVNSSAFGRSIGQYR